MAAYRYPVAYRRPRRYKSPYVRRLRSRRQSSGALPVVIAGAVLLAGAGAAKGAVAVVHSHAKAHAQPGRHAAAVTGSGELPFIAAVLNDLGAPDTEANKRSLLGWFPREYPSWPPWAANNPMSSTLPMPGVTVYNTLQGGGHVWNYPTAGVGAQATALTLEGGDWYPRIVALLRSGAGLCGNPSIASELLTWSGNGYSEVC